MIIYTQDKQRLHLKEPELDSGTEGRIYEIKEQPDRLAKIYIRNPSTHKDKIMAMIRFSNTDLFHKECLERDTSWPLCPFFDHKGRFIGFGMKRIVSVHDLDKIYRYPCREKQPPMDQKIRILQSLCFLHYRFHAAGQVIGDNNPSNFKVASDLSVKMTDADSVHFRNGSKLYPCKVAAPGYVAPEIIKACGGRNFADHKGETFTIESDRFALAVTIFRMLFNGIHPFDPKQELSDNGSVPAAVPLDQRVVKGETPFFKRMPGLSIRKYSPSVKGFPDYIMRLFYRAFIEGAADPSRRPDEKEWAKTLQQYKEELRQCPAHHFYWKGARGCPYCGVQRRYNGKTVTKAVNNPPSTGSGTFSVPYAEHSFLRDHNRRRTARRVRRHHNSLSYKWRRKPFEWCFETIIEFLLHAVLLYVFHESAYLELIGAPSVYDPAFYLIAAVISTLAVLWYVVHTPWKEEWWDHFGSMMAGIMGFGAGVIVDYAVYGFLKTASAIAG